MNTLDNPRSGIDEASVPFFQTALRFGLIGGLISITFAMVGQLTGLSKPTNMFSSIIVGLISILITISRQIKKMFYIVMLNNHRNILYGSRDLNPDTELFSFALGSSYPAII